MILEANHVERRGHLHRQFITQLFASSRPAGETFFPPFKGRVMSCNVIPV
jgi:hypothetical protein